MTLNDLQIGESAVISKVGGEGALRQHFLDMGVIPGAEVTVVRYAPMGDPVELLIHGYDLTLRMDDAAKIDVTAACEPAPTRTRVEVPDAPAPLDEQARPEGDGPLPDGAPLTFALVGNQNCGKTTLFNQLTGANQHVGNFPGVTMDRKDGTIKGHPEAIVTDLPGIYSMSPYSSEEVVSRNFVMNERPAAVIDIVDATNVERNLYLTMQLLEMDRPMVVALNMMDEVAANGGTVDVKRMEALLGVPVVPISAVKNQGVSELIDCAIRVARNGERPRRLDFCDPNDHGGAVHRALHGIGHLIEDHAEAAGIPVRFAASKVVEGDRLVISQLMLDAGERRMLEDIVEQMERERGLDRSAAIADMRYAYIYRVCEQCVKKPQKSKESIRSERIDRVLTGKWTAIPLFVLIMGTVFWLTFDVIGGTLQEWLQVGVDYLSGVADAALTAGNVNPVLHGLVIDGLFAGVGMVLSFLPIIVTLFFFLSLLEDSGYIARLAFFMDKLMRKIGLSGKSIVPMLIGFGCTVPAVMSTRALPSERDRKMTILLTPYMSCMAKLPIYAFFVDAFFEEHRALIMVGLYFLGIAIGVLAALLYRGTLFKGESVPFVMELPNYRMPGAKNVIRLLWDKARDFLQRAFTIILVATIAVWLLSSFDVGFNLVEDQQESMLAAIAGWLAPVMRPLGLGDWRVCTSLIVGFMAKESVVSTLQILFGQSVATVITRAAAAALLVFSLLYTPCVAAVTSIRRELGSKWAVGVVVWQCAVAWVAAFVTYCIAVIV